MSISTGTRALLGEAMSWVAAALILAAGITHLDEIRSTARIAVGGATEVPASAPSPDASASARRSSSRTVEIPAAANGHYFAKAEINGRPIDVLVDTGATIVALTYEDAERAGVRMRGVDFTGRVNTANGFARVAPVKLDRVEIAGITVRNVEATVSERGRLTTTLLGMSFLSRLDRVDIRQGVLILSQ
ncbi:MAG: TIGR02281 family clan AA aspartic protease [Hyphomicrobium sp.]|jgi:aspartyl protease family protein